MNQQSKTVSESGAPQAGAAEKVRQPARVVVGRLKAERVEQPLSAAQVLETMAGLPGWGLSPKGLRLARSFYFPSEEDAKAYMDFLLDMGRGMKVRTRVTIDDNRVYLTLRGRKGGIPPYLLDFAALLSQ